MAWFRCNGNQFKGYIDIYSTANALVTATTTGKAYSATCDGNGYARIKVKKKGAYNVTSTGTNRVAHATVNDKTPVTAKYNWQKWDSLLQYYQATAGKSVGGVGQWSNSTTIWSTGLSGAKLYYNATGYYLDSNSGNFVMSGGQNGSAGNSYSAWPGYYFGYPLSYNSNINPKMFTNSTGTEDEFSISCWVNWTGDFIYQSMGEKAKSRAAYGTEIYSYGGYIKGSTQYADATGTTLDALPSNGRADDGYWYIAS